MTDREVSGPPSGAPSPPSAALHASGDCACVTEAQLDKVRERLRAVERKRGPVAVGVEGEGGEQVDSPSDSVNKELIPSFCDRWRQSLHGWQLLLRMAFVGWAIVAFFGRQALPKAPLSWPAGWFFLLYAIIGSALVEVITAWRRPRLFRERQGAMLHPDTPAWDRPLAAAVFVLPFVALAFGGLDLRMRSWTVRSWIGVAGGIDTLISIQMIATVVCVAARIFAYAAMLHNPFFSFTAHVQKDRRHSVVSTGLYRIVRHPAYAAEILFAFFLPFSLLSAIASAPCAAMVLCLAVRVRKEDRWLHRELAGYKHYAETTPCTIIAGLW